MSLPDKKRERYSRTMKKKSQKRTTSLSLHELLGAVSFWGTATRAFLFSFVALAVFASALSEAASESAIDTEIMAFVYVIGSFVLLDFGYVLIARTYRLRTFIDRLALYVADIFLTAIYFIPNLVVNPQIHLTTDPLLFIVFIPIVVLSLRMLVGILFGSRK